MKKASKQFGKTSNALVLEEALEERKEAIKSIEELADTIIQDALQKFSTPDDVSVEIKLEEKERTIYILVKKEEDSLSEEIEGSKYINIVYSKHTMEQIKKRISEDNILLMDLDVDLQENEVLLKLKKERKR